MEKSHHFFCLKENLNIVCVCFLIIYLFVFILTFQVWKPKVEEIEVGVQIVFIDLAMLNKKQNSLEYR